MPKVELKLRARVIEENGIKRLEFTNPQYYRYMLNRLNLKEDVIVTIENQKSKRSNQQNAYLWSACYPVIAETTGHDIEEIHCLMKSMFLPKKFIEVKGIEFEIERSTTKLSIAECSEYIEKIRNFSAVELNAPILSPEEAGYHVAPLGSI